MTPERLAQLRQFARHVAYHVPGLSNPLRDTLIEADAGDDMVELCDAAAVNAELLAALKRQRCSVCLRQLHNPPLAHHPCPSCAADVAAIAKAEGR